MAGTRLTPRRPDVIDEAFGDEAVLVHLRTGRYYSLEGSAGTVWQAIGTGADLDAVAEAVGAPVDAIVEFLRRLAQEDLIAIDGDPLPAHHGATLPEEARLIAFEDLEDILRLDPIHDIDLDGTGWPAPPAAA